MFIAVRIKNDETEAKICYTGDEMFSFFFSPIYDEKYCIPLKVHGKTYAEKKADLEQQAIDYSNVFSALEMYMSELLEIQNFFYRNGKRYGLLTDFRENGIC